MEFLRWMAIFYTGIMITASFINVFTGDDVSKRVGSFIGTVGAVIVMYFVLF